MNLRNKIDFKSIRFRLWLYFIGFAMLLIGLIWFLQLYFLDNYYEEMKKQEVAKMADQVVSAYEREDYDLHQLSDYITDLLESNEDVYIRVETTTGSIIISPQYMGPDPVYRYARQIDQMRTRLLADDSTPSVSMITRSSGSNENTGIMSYACYLNGHGSYILYVISPLYPLQSTVSIMRAQLIYITVIALILALTLALYLASRISKPIKDITRSAAEMGKGHYGVKFDGAHYTEIIDLADTLTHASQELEKTDMYQKDLIANVSHDLRTPLTMIKSYAEMIRDLSGDIPEKRDAHLSVIIEETDRLNVLVTDMLNMSRLQNRTITLERSNFDMKKTLESILASYDLLCEQEGYRIKFHCPSSYIVNGDEDKIKQVLSNLINNAVKYCGTDKKILVTVKRVGRKIRCEVTDHGAGIAPDELTHVWERYYKSSTHHARPAEGSGLGLSIVKEILILHKTDYGVNSRLGKGSTFWFQLDLVRVKK